MSLVWAPPLGWRRFKVTWNWNQWGAAAVASEAGCIPAMSRDRSYIYSPYSSSMTHARLKEAWHRLDGGRDDLPFPRKVSPAPTVLLAYRPGVGRVVECV